MAIYDPEQTPEARLAFNAGAPPLMRPVSRLASVEGIGGGERAPGFIGGELNTATGNLMPGTLEGAKTGTKVTATPTRLASVTV